MKLQSLNPVQLANVLQIIYTVKTIRSWALFKDSELVSGSHLRVEGAVWLPTNLIVAVAK